VRAKLLAFFAAQPPCAVATEACAGAHHWARELGKLGRTVRLIRPYVAVATSAVFATRLPRPTLLAIDVLGEG